MGYHFVMRANSLQKMLFLTALFPVAFEASGIESKMTTRDYQTIVERNPFGLKPPPPPPAAPTNEPPKLEFYLTGMTSIGAPKNPKRAYLMSKDAKAPNYYSLTEGQSKDGLEILQIDPKTKSVKVRYNGNEKLMTFATDGIPVAKTAVQPPGARPGQLGQPGVPVPLPNAVQPGFPAPVHNTAPAPRTIPSRSMRTQPPPTYGGASAPLPAASAVTTQPEMNADEQLAILHRQQAATRQAYGLPPVSQAPNVSGPYGNPRNPNYPVPQGTGGGGIPVQEQVFPPIPPP